MRFIMWVQSLLIVSGIYAAEIYTDPKTGLSVLQAEIELPAEGFWYLHPDSLPREHLGFSFLLEPEEIGELHRGQRTHALRMRRAEQERRRLFSRAGHTLYRQREHLQNRTPLHWRDLDLTHQPDVQEAFESGILALIPDRPIHLEDAAGAEPILLELQPLQDDGKHWVRYNTWRMDREEILPDRLASLNLIVTPAPLPERHAEMLTYTLYARVFDPELSELTLTLSNDYPEAVREVTLEIGGASDVREPFEVWAEERTYFWLDWHSRIARMWADRAPHLYGVDSGMLRDPEFNSGRSASIMSVFGGDAAIRETLQLQNLQTTDPDESEERVIPIEEIQGVTVKSHAYGDLLGDAPSPALDLARFCPPDRFFIWFPQPAPLADLLEGTDGALSGFLQSDGTEILDHDVLDRHLEKLGIPRTLLRQILKQDLLKETALFLPDLFLREGTDITTLSRLRHPRNAQLLFALLDTFPQHRPVHRWLNGDLLILSSSAAELQQVKQLVEASGEDSLGASAEFRYMLTQNPVNEQTLAYVYFSDAFIRRLTGPELKIAQYRRLHAKTELERLAAGHLLYQLDQRKTAPDLQTLIESGYAPELRHLQPDTLEWDRGVAADSQWGSAARMTTLLENIPDRVTPSEKKAYDQYRTDYERFWQQFFDPISIHVERRSEDELQTTVFILPLINSSIYDLVRGWFDPSPDRPALNRPVIEPPPVAMLSLNLAEAQWLDILDGVSEAFEDVIGFDLPIWEFIGPGLHMGLADSDAVLTFGSGELLELFSARSGVRNNEMVWIPMMVSLLTRPVVLALDLTDAEAMRAAMNGMMTGRLLDQQDLFGLSLDLNRITGEERWLLRMHLGEVLFMTFSLEVQNDYLVISNLPLTYTPTVTARQQDALKDAGLLLQPHAIHETAPGFAAAALDRARGQAHSALGTLHIFHQSGSESLEEALASAGRLFGFTPIHPVPGTFVWNAGEPVSSTFGYFYEGRQPPLKDISTRGLLPPIHSLDLSMQLENEGLRTRIRWKR